MSREAKKSIADSLTRIIKYNHKDIIEDQIILARVVTVYSDILDTDTFGTMDCYDERGQIDIIDVPLNAHINDDGTSGISGKYTFPKVNSDIYLMLDTGVNMETYIPIMFSHIDSVYETYDTSVKTSVIGVDTADPTKPYDTEPNGESSVANQTSLLDSVSVTSNDNSGGSSRSQEYNKITDSIGNSNGGTSRIFEVNSIVDSINGNLGASNHTQTHENIVDVVQDNSNGNSTRIEHTGNDVSIRSIAQSGSTSIELNPTKITINGNASLTTEPAVMGDTLEGLLQDLIDAINGMIITVAGTSGTVSPPSQVLLNAVKAQLSTMKNLGVDLK